MYSLIKPYIFNLDPEVAHDLAIKSLKFNFVPKSLFKVEGEEILKIKLFNKELKNPIGLAAGFDKSAEVYNTVFKLGFGFVEVGTVTPRQQFGNPKPRVFRLVEDKALINRLGFNNVGLDTVKERIKNNEPEGFLGINIGPNKDTKDKIEDYIKCYSGLNKLSNYITINISSPNTEGLRDFHDKKLFIKLLDRIMTYKDRNKVSTPITIKLSPDITDQNIEEIKKLILDYNIDGVIISNSSDQSRNALLSKYKNETGGVSGQPIKNLSDELIKKFYTDLKNKVEIIGVGGVQTANDVINKLKSGATAVQLYTGMVFEGPNIVKNIKKELIAYMRDKEIKNLKDIIGKNTN